ncbi:MAG TPA: N-acetyltransferase [Promicromonospora sp.]|nr:N-acetyltransferase [Promicromonospora sp.]
MILHEPARMPRTDELALRPITADDAARDHDAVMEARADLRLWEQSAWPEDDFTVEANRADLAGLEERHVAGHAFTYTVLDPASPDPADPRSLGCVYVFPTTAAFLARSAVTPLADEAWGDVQAVVYFWVRTSRTADGLDRRLLDTLRTWFADDWGVERTVFVTNEQFTQQVGLLENSGLTRRFALVEPGKAGTYLIYG